MHGNEDASKQALNEDLRRTTKEIAMQLFKELLTTDAGLMSAAGIVFMLGMGVFSVRYFFKHIHEDTLRTERAPVRKP